MIKMKTKVWVGENLERLRFLYTEIAEDKIRDRRNDWRKFEGILKEFFEARDLPLTNEEVERLKKMDSIINNALAYGYVLENKDYVI